MTWASYSRVSSDGQTGLDKYGLERQDRDNERYIKRTGYNGAITAFRDVISGTKESRAEFEKLLKAARAGAIRRVCIPEPDRLAREAFSGVALIFELWSAGVEVHNSQRGLIDRSSGESRRAFFGDLIAADSELEKITRRMHAGRLDKARDGKTVAPLNGYGWNNGEPDEAQREVIRWAAREVLTRGCNDVCRELNERGVPPPRTGARWGHSSLRAILRNPVLIGRYTYGRKTERIEVAVPPILDDHTFFAVQRALEQRRRWQGRPGSRVDRYQLGGRIRCGACGHAMIGWTPTGKTTSYYQCNDARGKLARCTHRTHYRTNLVHDAVKTALEGALSNIETVMPRAAPVAAPTVNRKALEARLARAEAAYLAGVDTLEEYGDRKRLIQAELARADETPPAAPPPDPARLRESLRLALTLETLHETARAVALVVTVAPGGDINLELGA